MNLECHCPDWAPNIRIINGPLVLQHVRQPGSVPPFKPIVFCPWCGQRLVPVGGWPPGHCQKCGTKTFGRLCGKCS